MKKPEIRAIIDQLLQEIEEEDVGISLFTSFYQNKEELHFFKEDDRSRVLKILQKLSDDSRQHKNILERIIGELGRRLHGN